MKRKGLVVTVALVGLACTFGSAGALFAEEGVASSSECIRCHTDLDKMDKYGAAKAGGSAAIAG